MSPKAQTLFVDAALLPDGWASNVTITTDSDGSITGVQANSQESRTSPRYGCLLPGVPNLHSHAHQRAMAGMAESAGGSADSFWSWRDVMYRHVRKISPEDLECIAAQLYVEMLKSGYTTVAEFQYLHHDQSGKIYDNPAEMTLRTCHAANAAGIGLTSLPVLYQFGGFGSEPAGPAQRRFINDASGYLRIVNEVTNLVSNDPNKTIGIAPHSLRAISKPLLDEVLDGVDIAELPIHIHIAEQTAEVKGCQHWCGKRPVEWLLSNYDVNERWCLVHATHMTDRETEDMAETGAVAGICTTTEANLGDGIFNARHYLSKGGTFGIGSDSQISVSPVEELRWFEYTQRLLSQTRNVIAPEGTKSTGRQLFDHSVSGGARACGRMTGQIAVGYRADFIVLDNEHPLLLNRPGDQLIDSWIFSGNDQVVTDVYVGGKQVVSGGHHPAEDEILANFKRTITRLTS